MTSLGKIDKKALRERYGSGSEVDYAKRSCEAWCPWPESNQHSLRNSILSRARYIVNI
jgi:hypothetical protein